MTLQSDSQHTPRRRLPDTDEELMGQFRAVADRQALDELLRRYTSPTLAIGHHFLNDHDSARDALQESFVRVIRHRRHYRPGAPFSSWYYAIVRNVCRDMLRRRTTRHAFLDRFAHHAPSQVEPLDGETDNLLAQVPELERYILTLRFAHGLTIPEIASALGSTPEAIKKRAQRALRSLRELLAR